MIAQTTRGGMCVHSVCCALSGRPQLGQLSAETETECPQSGHGFSLGRSFINRVFIARRRPGATKKSPFFEIALVFVCLDHVASVIINADDGII
jgi:hypothetical protein